MTSLIRYYDGETEQLIYVSHEPTSDYWDQLWQIDENIKRQLLAIKKNLVTKTTRRYLKPGDGIILEGGCGAGYYISSLCNSGFRAVGVDFAYNTVRALNEYIPELEIIPADVRYLPFPDNFFAGYWSLGVIEHFWEGYERIAGEMYRVIRKGGYLFLTFPYMSPLRRAKANWGCYQVLGKRPPAAFHQFALRSHAVIRDFSEKGFVLLNSVPHDAVTGMLEEMFFVKKCMQILLDCAGNQKLCGYLQSLLNRTVSSLCGHCILLVFRKS